MPFVDGFPVPELMTPQQIAVLFPHGLVGLYDERTGRPVFPRPDGSVLLDLQHSYRLPPRLDYAVQDLRCTDMVEIAAAPLGVRSIWAPAPAQFSAKCIALVRPRAKEPWSRIVEFPERRASAPIVGPPQRTSRPQRKPPPAATRRMPIRPEWDASPAGKCDAEDAFVVGKPRWWS